MILRELFLKSFTPERNIAKVLALANIALQNWHTIIYETLTHFQLRKLRPSTGNACKCSQLPDYSEARVT